MSSSHWRAIRVSSIPPFYTPPNAPDPLDRGARHPVVRDLRVFLFRLGAARVRLAADEPAFAASHARVDLRLHRAAGGLGHLLPAVRAAPPAAAQAPLRSRA